MKKVLLCKVSDIAENAARGFSLSEDKTQQDIFVIKRDGKFYAYQNRCPHTGVSLNWQPDQFLDIEEFFIQCSVHGALFRVEDGFCVRGPCVNQSLTSCPVHIENGCLYAEIIVD